MSDRSSFYNLPPAYNNLVHLPFPAQVLGEPYQCAGSLKLLPDFPLCCLILFYLTGRRKAFPDICMIRFVDPRILHCIGGSFFEKGSRNPLTANCRCFSRRLNFPYFSSPFFTGAFISRRSALPRKGPYVLLIQLSSHN